MLINLSMSCDCNLDLKIPFSELYFVFYTIIIVCLNNLTLPYKRMFMISSSAARAIRRLQVFQEGGSFDRKAIHFCQEDGLADMFQRLNED